MWGKKTVAVIIPIANNSLALSVVQDYDSTGYVDEVIVVGEEADSRLGDSLARTRARYVKQSKPGLGIAIREGVNKTGADLVIITEADGTFIGRDILKLLSYSDDFDVVFGSRTHVPLIAKSSGMTFARRLVDDLFGKITSVLFLSSPLTDVGCTLRLTNRKAWKGVQKYFKCDSEMFLTEWLLLIVKNKTRFIEIPVHFVAKKKKTQAKTASYFVKRAVFILFYIIKIRFFV
ncbi:MAG: glycosyltransferase [Candidatus Curtissbacteria bacterium]|nr:glycosyltransferase [Candidatus Curtissbacteria bacterium]